MSAAPERGQQVLPGSVSQPVAEDSENRTSAHEPPTQASRSQSMLSRLGSNMGPFEPKSLRGIPASPSSPGKTRERRPAVSKSVSVRSLISQSNSFHRMDPVDRSSASDSCQADARSDHGMSGGNLTNAEESAQLAAVMDPAIPTSPAGAPPPLDSSRDAKFTGPLKDLYPDDVIVRPHRQDEVIWNHVMDINEHWQTHAAEDSGLTTFWQAMLAASRSLNTAIAGLSTLAEKGQLKDWMVKNVAMATGQVANAIALAWQHDHLDNLARLPEAEKRNLNIDAQERRHDQLLKRLWSVLNQLDDTLHTARVNPAHATHVEDMEYLTQKLKEFHGYLTVTVKLVLEDALFFYRNAMAESKFSCVGHERNSHGKIDPAVWSATMALIVGLTPPHQRMTCLRSMGYGWVASKALCARAGVSFIWNFHRPLNAVSRAASKFTKGQNLNISARRTV